MAKFKSETAVFIVLISIAAILVGYNVFSVETQKIEVRRQMEEQARLEKEMLEEIKSREAGELAEYYKKYRIIRAEFIKKADELSEELEGEIANIDKLKELTTGRLDVAKGYREELTGLDTPGPLETFLVCELEFIESDIETISMVLSYYESGSYSTYDDGELSELYKKTNLLLHKADEELCRVYSQYELEYLLEGQS